MAVFVALLVFHRVPDPSPDDVQKTLRTFLPNDTKVWKMWREKAVLLVCDKPLSCLTLDEKGDGNGLTESDQKLLGILLSDARAACDGYSRFFKL